jgi:hypothetical protein
MRHLIPLWGEGSGGGEGREGRSERGMDRESVQSVGCEPSSDENNFTSESETRIKNVLCVKVSGSLGNHNQAESS